ncbi:MAG TPA: LacI family DNA-binding transcriptional regulator [Arachnia sp.]|nr:LacI family DNA-binding transcriptional regulator [Arachnia sp.]
MATYKDIQRLTGLSLSTISKYFNNLPVREANRRAIEEAAATLRFRRNAFARGLRTNRSRVVGVLLPELDNPFHMSIIAGVEAALRAEGVGILVRAAHQDLVSGVEMLREHMVDGIIAVPTDTSGPGALIAALGDLPLVLLDRRLDGVRADSVTIDNEAAGARAAECLLAFGHQQVAALVGPPSVWTMRGRARGFVDALGAGHVTVLNTASLTVAAGHSAMAQALASRNRPKAVFCANYELTLGALTAITNEGLNVPNDVSFVGFDGGELAEITKPRLWTLVQPVDQMAARTAELMLARLWGEAGTPREVVLPAQLLPGDSIAAPA